MKAIKKIVVLGPESTGKSTLCEKLATHYNTLWVPEYAREYLEKHGAKYSYDDLLTIAKGQIGLEDFISYELEGKRGPSEVFLSQKTNIDIQAASSSPPSGAGGLLFIDTDMYVMKVWCEYVFNQCHNWILSRIAEREYHLYLLCDIDLPWVEDTLREYPDKKIRERLFNYYKDLMVNQPVPWCIISGDYEERFKKAVSFIETAFT